MLTIHITEADPAAGAVAPLRAKTGSPSVSRSMACPPTWCTRRSRLWPTCKLCDCANARRSKRGKSRHTRRERAHRRPRRLPGVLPRGVSHRRTISLSTSRQKTSRPPTNSTLIDGLSCCA